jgi:hypothetical protein
MTSGQLLPRVFHTMTETRMLNNQTQRNVEIGSLFSSCSIQKVEINFKE